MTKKIAFHWKQRLLLAALILPILTLLRHFPPSQDVQEIINDLAVVFLSLWVVQKIFPDNTEKCSPYESTSTEAETSHVR